MACFPPAEIADDGGAHLRFLALFARLLMRRRPAANGPPHQDYLAASRIPAIAWWPARSTRTYEMRALPELDRVGDRPRAQDCLSLWRGGVHLRAARNTDVDSAGLSPHQSQVDGSPRQRAQGTIRGRPKLTTVKVQGDPEALLLVV
jgi:hypothetical protein